MSVRSALIASTLSLSLLAPLPALAAQPSYDSSAISAGCSGSATSCSAAVTGAINTLSATMTPAQLNEQIGLIAAQLMSIARTNPRGRRGIASALAAAAGRSTNVRQVAALRNIALDVVAGRTPATPQDAFGSAT